MAKVTEQDVISFLKQKVAQLSRDLEFVQNALNVLEGTSSQDIALKKGRNQSSAKNNSQDRRKIAKTTGAKRGRKPKSRYLPSERIMAADQLG